MLKKLADQWNKRIWLLLLLGPYLAKNLANCTLSTNLVLFIACLVIIEMINAIISQLIKNKFNKEIQVFLIPSIIVLFYYDSLIEFVLYVNGQLFHLAILKARYYIPLFWMMGVYLCQKKRRILTTKSQYINAFLSIYTLVILGTAFIDNSHIPTPASHFISIPSDQNKPVVLIVLDEYASPNELYKYKQDNSLFAFSEKLENSGWIIQPQQKSNHLKTANSLASLFNYNYSTSDKQIPLTFALAQLKQAKLIKELELRGVSIYNYGIFDLGNSPAFTKLYFYEKEAFERNFLKQVLAGSMFRLLYGIENEDQNKHNQFLINHAFQQISETKQMKAFYYVHLLMPHLPFEYAGKQKYITKSTLNSVDNYIPYYQFTNKLVYAELIKPLVNTKAFKVIVTGDHGYRWDRSSINPYLTMTAYYGFTKDQTQQVKSVQDLGILIYASY